MGVVFGIAEADEGTTFFELGLDSLFLTQIALSLQRGEQPIETAAEDESPKAIGAGAGSPA